MKTSDVEEAIQELGAGWVEAETESADFGDARLSTRYRKVLEQMSKLPQSPFTQSSEDLSEMAGAYRFIENEKVSVEKILFPHREQLRARAEGEGTLLLIQDTTYFDFSNHKKCDDLHPLRIANSKKALWLHATVCVLPNGRPLGILDAQYMSGAKPGSDSKSKDSRRPIEEKQSERWLAAVDRCQGLFDENIRRVWICDREADIYELIEHIQSKGEDFVIRSKFLRAIEDPPFFDMRQHIEESPTCGSFELAVAATSKSSKRKVNIEVKFAPAAISCPAYKRNAVDIHSVQTWIVEAREISPPDGETSVHWRLLTSVPVRTFEEAMQVIQWYRKRWTIEEHFKILKSGCRAEKAQFHSTARISKYITLSLIVAWRIYFLVHINRLDPEAPAETVLTSPELQTLQLLLDDKRKRKGHSRRIIIRTASQAITQIAKLGGYLDRKKDLYPGVSVLWRGTIALGFSTLTFLAHQRAANSALMLKS